MGYDVIVVGAGPAGLSTALTSATHGLKTLLLERNFEIGHPVKSSAFTFIEVPQELGLSKSVVLSKISKLYIEFLGRRKKIEVDFLIDYGVTLNLPVFLKELAQKAMSAGALIKVGQNVTGPLLENGRVCGVISNSIKIRSKLVIDASGNSAVIGRSRIKYPTFPEIGVGREYEVFNFKNRDTKSIDFYVGSGLVPVSYGWAFPIGSNETRVGVATVLNTRETLGKSLKKVHDTFFRILEKRGGVRSASICSIHVGDYPLIKSTEKNYGAGFVVVGDAAGHANPLLGEGIRNAVEYGQIAGKMASNAVAKNDFSEAQLNFSNYLTKTQLEYYSVAKDLLSVSTDIYWETIIKGLTKLKIAGNLLPIMKYLRAELNYSDVKNYFPEFASYLKDSSKS